MEQEELSQAEFEKILGEMPTRREKVLLGVLKGKTDQQIAEELRIYRGTVRNHISKLHNDFRLKKTAGKRHARRAELILLVAKYKPELLERETFIKPIKDEIRINPTKGTEIINSNPFSPTSGRVDDPEVFFGREQEVQRILKLLNNGVSIAVIGERGIGKSSLLWAICQRAERLIPARKRIFLDLSQVTDEEGFYSALCEEIEIPFSRGYRLSKNLKPHRILLGIDNAGKMITEGFSMQLRYTLRGLSEGMNAPIRLVITAYEHLDELFPEDKEGKVARLAGICQEEELTRWSESTAAGFIKARLAGNYLNFETEEIIQLVQESEGHPQKLMRLCQETYSRKQELIPAQKN